MITYYFYDIKEKKKLLLKKRNKDNVFFCNGNTVVINNIPYQIMRKHYFYELSKTWKKRCNVWLQKTRLTLDS
jgi:hypothetical protein